MLILVLLPLIHSTCTTQQYFTPCSPFQTRSGIIFRSSDCTLPSSKFENLDCKFSCPSGTFLEILESGDLSCSPCPPGTFSIGGGTIFGSASTNWSSVLSSDVISDCWVNANNTNLHNYECQGWVPYLSNLQTSQAPFKVSYTSRLIFSFRMVKDGFFDMQYKKDSFRYNGLVVGTFSLFLRGLQIFQDTSVNQAEWKIFKMPLMPGNYEITIEYSVLATESFPDPKAFISTVEVYGTSYADLKCLVCSEGNGKSGDVQCQRCSNNQYWLTNRCMDCPINTYSLPGTLGLEGCIERTQCTAEDSKKIFSDCIDEKRNESYEWIQPIICDPSQTALAETRLGVSCGGCPKGLFWNKTGNFSQCVSCSPGSYLNTDSQICSFCEPGTQIETFLNISEFTSVPLSLNTFCLSSTGSLCSPNIGWFALKGYLSTGNFFHKTSEKYLSSTINIIHSGHIKISYFLSPDSKIKVLVDGQVTQLLTSINKLATVSLTQGLHTVQFVFSSNSEKKTEARIYFFEIWGADRAPAVGCKPCGSGYVTNTEGNCVKCPVGYQSNENKTICEKCSNDSVSDTSGEMCRKCVSGTKANKNSSFCLGNDFLNNKNDLYLVEHLTGLGTSSQKNTSLCNLTLYSLYCHQTFYGPLVGNDKSFYVSVLNPSVLELPEMELLYETRPGYAYAVVEQQVLTHKKVTVERTCVNDMIIVSLGSRVKGIEYGLNGFSIEYEEGDFCETGKFGSNIDFVCDKATGTGWPSFESVNGCIYSFTWKSKFGCRVCSYDELRTIRTQCVGGKRFNRKVEPEECIFPYEKSIEWVEDCSEFQEFIYRWPVMVLLGFLFVLMIVGVIGFVFYFKYRAGYKQLALETEH